MTIELINLYFIILEWRPAYRRIRTRNVRDVIQRNIFKGMIEVSIIIVMILIKENI